MKMISQKFISPLPWREGIKGRETQVNEIMMHSPSHQPSPFEGEGVFLTLCEPINEYLQ